MSYLTTSLDDLGYEANKINKANGWDVLTRDAWPSDNSPASITNLRQIGTLLCLIHSETSEALEALRKRDKENFTEELADVLIRTVTLAESLGLDLDNAVRAKMEKNRARGLHHGGKAV